MVRVRAAGGIGSRGRAPACAAALLVGLLVGCASSPSEGRDAGGDARATDTTEVPVPSGDATASSAPTTTAVTSTTVPVVDLRSADLVRRTYRVLCPGGEIEVDASVASTPGAGGVALSGFAPQFYDLTGDGRPEAVVPVICTAAGDWASAVASVIVVAVGPVGPAQMGGPIAGRDPVVVGRMIGVGRPVAGATRYESLEFVDGAWGPAGGGAPLTEADPAVPEGIGAVTIGAPFGELAIATGQVIEVSDPLATGGACVEVAFPAGPTGIRGLGGDGMLRALEIRTPGIRTVEGLGVGSTEADVLAAHAGEVGVFPTIFGGNDLVRTPLDFPDLITVFHSDGVSVTGYGIGEPTWADAPAGCA